MFSKIIVIIVLSISSFVFAQVQSVPGEFIIKLRAGANEQQLFGSSAARSLFTKKRRLFGTKGRMIRVKVSSGSTINALRAFGSSPMVQYIEPNYIIQSPKYQIGKIVNNTGAPADEMFSKLWGLYNKDYGYDLGALDAWKMTTGSKKVVVAVIDTGVDYTHPDLTKNVWINEKELNGTPGVDDDGNGLVDDIHGYDFANNDGDPMDDNAHGTHCSGTIGAVHNTIGVAGVAANVRIMAVKFLTGNGGGTLAGAIESIHYAVDNGAHVLSNSWGGEMRTEPESLKEAVEYANSKGVVFVAAAGNANNNNDEGVKGYPASHKVDNVISVAAFQANGKRASFSSYGPKSVHVAAPGKDILSTIPQGKYASFSGTSMATPHVSGVVALLLSLNSSEWVNNKGEKRNLNINPKLVRDLLIGTSIKNKDLDSVTVSNGFVSASELLKTALSKLSK